jgi:hypothetical protein
MVIQLSEYRAQGRLPKGANHGAHGKATRNARGVVVCMSDHRRRIPEEVQRLAQEAAISELHGSLDRIYALATQI